MIERLGVSERKHNPGPKIEAGKTLYGVGFDFDGSYRLFDTFEDATEFAAGEDFDDYESVVEFVVSGVHCAKISIEWHYRNEDDLDGP